MKPVPLFRSGTQTFYSCCNLGYARGNKSIIFFNGLCRIIEIYTYLCEEKAPKTHQICGYKHTRETSGPFSLYDTGVDFSPHNNFENIRFLCKSFRSCKTLILWLACMMMGSCLSFLQIIFFQWVLVVVCIILALLVLLQYLVFESFRYKVSNNCCIVSEWVSTLVVKECIFLVPLPVHYVYIKEFLRSDLIESY